MAERTTKLLASYEAARTTERLPCQAITGLPRSIIALLDRSINASMSTWMILRTIFWQQCYSGSRSTVNVGQVAKPSAEN
jgi:hypothetical protein